MKTGFSFSSRGKVAFTRTELLITVAIVAILAVLLLLMGSPGERKNRLQCQIHLQQLARSLRLYASDQNDLLPDCSMGNPHFSGSHWPWDLNTNLVSALERRGAARQDFYCPSNPDMNNDQRWNFWKYTGDPIRVVGYAFLLKGIHQVPSELWRTSLAAPSKTPPAKTELVLDATVSFNGDYQHIQGKWMDRTSHLEPGGQPAGGNIAFEDGHTEWRDFRNMQHRIFGDAVWDF